MVYFVSKFVMIKPGNVSPIIVSFDIATEVFRFTQLTPEYGSLLGLGVYSNKHEVHYVTEEDSGFHFIRVWVTEEVASESGKSLRCTHKYRIGPMPGRKFNCSADCAGCDVFNYEESLVSV
ncbi:hypothetical protein K1719_001864 [Acacia pycnantha]|nr:hypothetical protein K1719_001864 [Acacia pycnantha]